ncbi:Choline transporter-like protein ctl1 [Escovopsis weberi]|uniref:Protein PNS1 n=1 Tax=Escovopsis weberi TaxID=150374 RepID=A0A0N0RU19_ESCWE|nr:Choline transporter-like protein ctl1 [Escovopsis weberi]
MFSEYASRFLTQSQSRLSILGQSEHDGQTRHQDPSSRSSRHQKENSRAGPSSRPYLSRGYGPSPYQQSGGGGGGGGGTSRFGQLAFASRISTAPEAPLFHSTLDEFREEDEEEERDREAADLFVLQKSRRLAAASKLAESIESDNNQNSRGSIGDSSAHPGHPYRERGMGRGIKSSWHGTRSMHRPRHPSNPVPEEEPESHLHRREGDDDDDEDDHYRNDNDNDNDNDRVSNHTNDTKGKMVDIHLDSQEEVDDDDPPESLFGAPLDNRPPAFQRFNDSAEQTPFIKDDSMSDHLGHGRAGQVGIGIDENTPHHAGFSTVEGDVFCHDPFFAWLFLINLASMVSTFVLVWLHTSPRSSPVGDTIYLTLQKSFHMLAVDTVVAVMVSFVWLAALRSFVRPLVSVILIAVPVIMFSFSVYSFTSSFKGQTHGRSLQDSVMRWSSLLPAASCILWMWMVVKGRRAIQAAIEILQFSSKILAQNPGLLLVGFGCLGLIVVWTWVWLAMFTRVFMGGYFSKSLVRFVIQVSSWWLGAAFVFMYMWTLSVINAVHRATTAATVSQWYFHRNAGPAVSSRDIVLAALSHALTTIFGSICQSTLLSLLIRAPLIFLPRRIGTLISNIASFWIPTPIVALTNPLTITFASIHSQGLATSARGLDQMEFVSTAIPTTTLTPRALRLRGSANQLLPYRLAKLLLIATRFIMATGLGFAGWVITAKQLQVQLPNGIGVRGSAYAYVVGMMASFIGYSVMGAMEGILSGIVDAVLICYGSERRMERGHGRFCLEAAHLFGERRLGREEPGFS